MYPELVMSHYTHHTSSYINCGSHFVSWTFLHETYMTQLREPMLQFKGHRKSATSAHVLNLTYSEGSEILRLWKKHVLRALGEQFLPVVWTQPNCAESEQTEMCWRTVPANCASPVRQHSGSPLLVQFSWGVVYMTSLIHLRTNVVRYTTPQCVRK